MKKYENEISRFDVCVLVDMWAPKTDHINFLNDTTFRNHFVLKHLQGRTPKANQYISCSRIDPIDPIIWTLLSNQIVAFGNTSVEHLEEHKFLKSKQDNICIIGQHTSACLLYGNLGILDFLQSGYENVYTDIDLNNPPIYTSASGLNKQHDFIFEDYHAGHKKSTKIQYEYTGSTIFKLKLLEDENENTDSRE